MKTVRVGNFSIGPSHPVFVVAEIGCNFTTFEEATRLIDQAKASGADAVKLQTFKADTLACRTAMFDMENTGRTSQYELFLKYQIDEHLHRQIFEYAASLDILMFSTPSHFDDVGLLEALNVPAHKIGSDDACNLPLLRYVAEKGKPIILSTGMCTLEEVREAVSTILATGNDNLVLLHCVTSYPTHPQHVNLRAMQTLSREFGLPVGYSDHTIGNDVCLAAVAMGAQMIEKHFTLDKLRSGPDGVLSADPEDLAALIKGIRTIEPALGDGIKRPAPPEISNKRNNRKSVVTVKAIAMGETVRRDMLDIKRPGMGISPKYIDLIVGRTARLDIPVEQVVTWEMLL